MRHSQPSAQPVNSMFDTLSERLSGVIRNLRGQARLTEDNIRDSLREVRMALLEADVALPVVRAFIARVSERAVGQDVLKNLNPGQALIKVVYDELVTVMGEECDELNLSTQPPAVILMAGLQGSGKTTTSAKLARLLVERHGKKPLLVSCDVYRPAAIEQLKTLGDEIGVEVHPSSADQNPVDIATDAIARARRKFLDVVIVDTAGRLHIDDQMMAEIQQLHAATNPIETLFVVDSMTGQDAANAARAFDQALSLTGVILTKTDGDARGGAALSIRHVTGKPIKFIGSGEKVDALEPFHPDRMASRILGMGDVLSLVEEVQQKVDQKQAAKLASKLRSGKGFTLDDFRDQMQQMQQMGGISSLLDKLPGAAELPGAVRSQVGDRETRRVIAIINSMTPQERRQTQIIKGSRKRRIATGAGLQVQDVNRLLKQFTQMQKMMKRMSKGGMGKMMRGLRGRMPPGMGF